MTQPERKRLGHWIKGLGSWMGPPRFLLFILVLIVATPISLRLLTPAHWPLALLAAFDVAALCFLLTTAPLLKCGDAQSMRRHAAENDANRLLLLIITIVVSVAILVTVASLLTPQHKSTPGAIPLVIASLAAAWLFGNTVFALHYAHLYYLPGPGGDRGGLEFPSDEAPDYWDFFYFSFTLGMTFQTSDVTIAAGHMRRIVLLHSVAGFVFNIGILAFVINTLGG